MAGQEDRKTLFPVIQIIGNELFRLVHAIGHGIAMGIELGCRPLQAAIMTEIGFQCLIQAGLMGCIVGQQGSQGPVMKNVQYLVIGLGKEQGIDAEGSKKTPLAAMKPGPDQSLLSLAAAVPSPAGHAP